MNTEPNFAEFSNDAIVLAARAVSSARNWLAQNESVARTARARIAARLSPVATPQEIAEVTEQILRFLCFQRIVPLLAQALAPDSTVKPDQLPAMVDAIGFEVAVEVFGVVQ